LPRLFRRAALSRFNVMRSGEIAAITDR